MLLVVEHLLEPLSPEIIFNFLRKHIQIIAGYRAFTERLCHKTMATSAFHTLHREVGGSRDIPGFFVIYANKGGKSVFETTDFYSSNDRNQNLVHRGTYTYPEERHTIK